MFVCIEITPIDEIHSAIHRLITDELVRATCMCDVLLVVVISIIIATADVIVKSILCVYRQWLRGNASHGITNLILRADGKK